MSFLSKWKPGSTPSGQPNSAPGKKDPNAPQLTTLEKHLATLTGPPRVDGSDKFFGFENYGSTCYCNSIIQCLYYSEPFREHVIGFPSKAFLGTIQGKEEADGETTAPRLTSTTPYPNLSSPARKANAPTSPNPGGPKPDENKDSPEYRKRMALQAGPVLDMTHDKSNTYGMDESLFTSLRDMFEAIAGHKSRIGVVSPHRFLEILRRDHEMFRSAMHQDAHEFFNLLLNSVVDNVELFAKQQRALPHATFEHQLKTAFNAARATAPTPTPDTHWVHDLFEGILTSETRCLTCETVSQRDEAFLDLSVDLDAHASVTSCLRRFSMEEMLRERNKFHCDNCGGLQEAEKRMKIKRLPHILTLHLKRFKYTEDLQRLQKLFHRVVYPFFLRLFNTTDEAEDSERVYELYAVVVHIGTGAYHGHYVSIIKTKARGWLLFDDELVEPVSKSYVENFFGGEPIPGLQDAKQLACAYVLFYQTTTEEAMVEELEAERQATNSGRVSDAETAKDGFSPTKHDHDLFPTATIATPVAEDTEHKEQLAHARTAPHTATLASPPARPAFNHLVASPVTPSSPGKTKKELKAEEKERKAREKEEKKTEARALEDKRKEEARALDEKRREDSDRRVENLRRQNEEMAAVMEASKATAAVEDAHRKSNDPPQGPSLPFKEGGLARFKTGSMSLRGRPKFFGGKDKDKKDEQPPATKFHYVPRENGAPTAAGAEESATDASQHSDFDHSSNVGHFGADGSTTALPALRKEEEKANKKSRFSLGRKKSTLMM